MPTEYDYIQMRRDTAAEWVSHNPILLSGEFGIETDSSPAKFKIGNGVTHWNSLPYAPNYSSITATTVNGLTLLALSVGFSIAGGTTSKTLTVPLDATVSGNNTGDQTVPVKASGAEIISGTDDAKFATAKALRDASALKKVVIAPVIDFATDVTTGTAKGYFPVPDELNGMNLIRVAATVITPGTTGSTTIGIYNVTDAQQMLSVNMAIETGEKSTRTSATPGTIDTAHDDVATGDILRFDIGSVSSTAPKGLYVELAFQAP